MLYFLISVALVYAVVVTVVDGIIDLIFRRRK